MFCDFNFHNHDNIFMLVLNITYSHMLCGITYYYVVREIPLTNLAHDSLEYTTYCVFSALLKIVVIQWNLDAPCKGHCTPIKDSF